MRANFSAEYFAFFTIFAQNPVACAELPHSCLPLDSSAFQPITPRFPSMQKRSPPHKLMRQKEDLYKELNLADSSLSEEALIQAMVDNPKLMERPIVVANGKARIGRPPEQVLEIVG